MSTTCMSTAADPSHPLLTEQVLILKNELKGHLTADPAIDGKVKDGLKEARETVLRDLRGLTTSIHDTKESFKTIGAELTKFDRDTRRSNTDDCADSLPPLGPKWDKFGTCFDTLLNRSYKNAANAISVLKIHNEALFPEGSVLQKERYVDMQDEIQNLIETIGEDEIKATEIEEGFAQLARDIRNFEAEIAKTVEARDGLISADIEETQKRVRVLRDGLSKVKNEMADIGLACIACLSAGALSAGFLFFTLSPSSIQIFMAAVLASLPSTIEFIEKVNEENKLTSEIKECNAQIAELTAQYEILKKYQEALADTNHEIEDLAAKIDSISGIWHYLKADFQLLHSNLSKAAGPKARITSFIGKKIDMSRALYRELLHLLEEYVRGIPSDAVGDANGENYGDNE